MIFAIDFDGTVVKTPRRGRPLELMPGVEDGLAALKAAGHALILSSARANLAIRQDLRLDPLVTCGMRPVSKKTIERDKELAEQRYREMISFIELELPDMFDAIDNGCQGKILADVYIDNRAINLHAFGAGPDSMSWYEIAELHGDPSRIEEMFEEET